MTFTATLFKPKAAPKVQDSIYIYDEEIVLAVNITLAVGRPLLVRGPSGCGKSTLARSVSRNLGVPYYEHVVTSRTRARDLLWKVDLLRRFHDAQLPSGDIAALEKYVEPGILWWAIDPASARNRGYVGTSAAPEAPDPGDYPSKAGGRRRAGKPGGRPTTAVVLIDEIDKADPDVPNDLLNTFETMQFVVEETGCVVRAESLPFVIVTSNDERELPLAFTRRCLELMLRVPDTDRLMEIGRAHFDDAPELLLRELAEVVAERARYSQNVSMPPPSTAEYLDAVKACLNLGISPGSREFEFAMAATALKPRRAEEDF